MAILSLQSAVACGHVGNDAATFVLQRLGQEVIRADTIHLSNHPGHGAASGRARPPEELAALLEGIARHGGFAGLEAVLSGYLASPGNGEVLRETLPRIRAEAPDCLYACDPVTGDDGRVYVAPGIDALFAGPLLAQADIFLPNAFELGHLAGHAVTGIADAVTAMQALRARMRPGLRIMVATGVPAGQGRLAVLALGPEGLARCDISILPAKFSGAGDAFSALFLAHYLRQRGTAAALAASAGMMQAILAASLAQAAPETASPELALITAQESWTRAAPLPVTQQPV